MDYEIPVKIKDKKNNIYNCVMRTELNDKYCFFLSNIPSFSGRDTMLPETKKGFEYSWILRDYDNDINWIDKFKGKREKIEKILKTSKTIHEFFKHFGFEYPTFNGPDDFRIVHQFACDNIAFDDIEL